MPGRSVVSSTAYRYGFNGKENDPETVGTGNGTQDYGMRIYNPSLGKFLSVDPISAQYPELTPYQFASNCPIKYIDIDGLEAGDPGNNSSRAALGIHNSESLKAERETFKNWGPPIVELAGNIVGGTLDASSRVVTSIFWSLVAGPYYGATGKTLPSSVTGFSGEKGFYTIKDPESSENLKILAKSTISLELGRAYEVLEIAPTLSPYLNKTIEVAKDVATDKVLDNVLPTQTTSGTSTTTSAPAKKDTNNVPLQQHAPLGTQVQSADL